jgi:hypothetical protein
MKGLKDAIGPLLNKSKDKIRDLLRGKFSWSTAFIATLSVVVPFGFDILPDYVLRYKSCQQKDYQSVLNAAFYYHRLIRLNASRVGDRRTKVVTISEGSEGGDSLEQHCVERDLESKLLLSLIEVRPAAIVLDFSFENNACSFRSAESLRLQAAIRAAAREKIYVVIGLGTATQEELERRGLEKTIPHKLADRELMLEPEAWFPVPAAQFVRYGLIRVACEMEILPLSWVAYQTSELNDEDDFPTLSKAIAQIFYPEELTRPRVQRADAQKSELWVPFLTENEIGHQSATKVICGDEQGPGAWKHCPVGPPNEQLSRWSSQVVIICSDGPEDRGATPFGPSVPGGFVQASYIETLLDATYYERASPWLAFFVSLGWFSVLQLNWRINENRFLRAVAIAIGISVLVVVGVFFVFSKIFEEWLVLWPPGAVAIVGKIAENLIKQRMTPNGES